MVFLAKKTSAMANSFFSYCKVEDTRSLSLSNSDSKVCAASLCLPVRRHRPNFLDIDQSGLSADSDCLTNILEIETALIKEAHTTDCSSIGFFLIFSNACPSLARDYIFLALEAAGFPGSIIRAIRNLYVDN